MSAPRKETLAEGVELWLGDSREVVPMLGPISTFVSDPPYGMEFQSNHRLEKHARISGDDDFELLRWACDLEAEHSKYLFCRWDNIAGLPKPKSLVTWVKNNWSMGDLEHEHARQTEVALFYPGPRHFFPNGRPTDVIEAPRTGNDNHPTEKPVMLMWAILRWTDGLVCDPFMGAGATGIAAVQLGRDFIGIEREPKYFDTACRRIEAELKTPGLFVEPPKPIKQEALQL
jgi:site-specific DNA-methyltransferase (adenine-specific)